MKFYKSFLLESRSADQQNLLHTIRASECLGTHLFNLFIIYGTAVSRQGEAIGDREWMFKPGGLYVNLGK